MIPLHPGGRGGGGGGGGSFTASALVQMWETYPDVVACRQTDGVIEVGPGDQATGLHNVVIHNRAVGLPVRAPQKLLGTADAPVAGCIPRPHPC